MKLQHEEWHSRGRTLIVLDDNNVPTGQFCFKAAMGQRNVKVGSDYVPYIYDNQTKELCFGRAKLKFVSSGIQFYRLNENSMYDYKAIASFHPELEVDSIWERESSVVSGFNVEPIITETYADKCHITYSVTTDSMQFVITVEAGGLSFCVLGFDITAKKAGKQRIVWDITDNRNGVPVVVPYIPKKNPGEKITGYQWPDHKVLWTYEEADGRNIGEMGQLTKIAMAEKDYVINEHLALSPDTWGATGIADTDDDCQEANDTTVDLDGYDEYGNILGRF